MLLSQPGFTLIAALTLALGIGANTAILGAAQGVIAQAKENSVNIPHQKAPTLPTLEVGKPVEREIKGGEVHLYQIHLGAGEFVRGTVDQRGVAINVRGLFPDGSKIRSFSGPPNGPKNFRFVAEAPGNYRLELKAADGNAAGQYQRRIEQVQPMAERLKIVPDEKYHSPRLTALRKELAAGDKTALEKFWREVEQRGTPLTETIEGDDKHLLVTFLWRATFETWNVLVVWAPYSAQQPDDYKMTCLADSNLWYKDVENDSHKIRHKFFKWLHQVELATNAWSSEKVRSIHFARLLEITAT